MKIEKVILSSTTNPYYLDFWPLVSKIWKKKFNIHPVLILIHDDKNIKVSEEYGSVLYLEPLKDIPVNTQAQCSRLFFPSLEPNTTWATSDIDMFPISRQYFIDNIQNISDDKFINLNAHVIGSNSICYNVAKGKTFKTVLDLPETFELFMEQTEWRHQAHTHRPTHGLELQYWFADEVYCNKKITHFHNNVDSNILYNPPRPGGFCARRLDRGTASWNKFNEDSILNEYYLDSHVARPYSQHKQKIDRLVSLILKENI